MTLDCVMKAMRYIRPWQLGQSNTSTANTRRRGVAHGTQRGLRHFRFACYYRPR
jgi:hypothetical protein